MCFSICRIDWTSNALISTTGATIVEGDQSKFYSCGKIVLGSNRTQFMYHASRWKQCKYSLGRLVFREKCSLFVIHISCKWRHTICAKLLFRSNTIDFMTNILNSLYVDLQFRCIKESSCELRSCSLVFDSGLFSDTSSLFSKMTLFVSFEFV